MKTPAWSLKTPPRTLDSPHIPNRHRFRGADTLEYVMLAAIFCLGICIAAFLLRDQVAGIFNAINNNLKTVAGGGNAAGAPEKDDGKKDDDDKVADYDITDPASGMAFAVYSEDDHSLNFYKRKGLPTEGANFCGKTITEIYTGLEENGGYWVGKWANRTDIKKVEVVDYGISPQDIDSCFFGDTSLEEVDMVSLGTSNLRGIQAIFGNCTSLREVKCNNWNTSKVDNMQAVFLNCSNLEYLSLYDWTVKDGLNMSCMFQGCTKLWALMIGPNWQWTGVGGNSYLPSQTDRTIIPNADGKWYDPSTGIGYKPSEMPSHKAGLYQARL